MDKLLAAFNELDAVELGEMLVYQASRCEDFRTTVHAIKRPLPWETHKLEITPASGDRTQPPLGAPPFAHQCLRARGAMRPRATERPHMRRILSRVCSRDHNSKLNSAARAPYARSSSGLTSSVRRPASIASSISRRTSSAWRISKGRWAGMFTCSTKRSSATAPQSACASQGAALRAILNSVRS
jgi:hypothetical protein